MTEERHELFLRPQPVEVGRARRHVAEVFGDVDDDIRSTLQVLTSEVVTNAIAHAGGDIVLRTSRFPGVVHVEVRDDSSQEPRLGSPRTDAEHGRGLLLLDGLAAAWGVRHLPGRRGKAVWFTLEV